MSTLVRTRWAGIGAAVAVTLGAGGFGLVNAAISTGEKPVFVAITPCRLVDTRAAANVQPRTTPFGPGEIYTISAHGNNGQCVGVPVDATALSLNVTALGATAQTYFTFWPTGAPQPNASSLNPAPSQPPTPNAVITDISAGGQFNIFNETGTVGAIIDINGYYVDHNHDDRYYTRAQVDTRVPASSSISLAGAAFVPSPGDLAVAGLTACFYNSTADAALRHGVPLPVGSTMTAISVRTTSLASQSFTYALFRQPAGTSNGQQVVAGSVAPTSMGVSVSTLTLPTPEVIEPGEAFYIVFRSPSAANVALCAIDIQFTRPT